MPKVTTNGVELYYIREGQGEPVILAPGLLFGADHWRPQIDALKDEYDVVAVDLRGQHHSQTTNDPSEYEMWNQAEDLYGLIRQLGIAPVHYVGLSLGGFLGMRLALKHPEAVRSLVLIDTTDLPENPELVEMYEAFRHLLETGEMEAVLPAMPPIFFKQSFIDGNPEWIERWFNELRAADAQGTAHTSRALDHRDDISDQTPSITVPTLVIHGTEDAAIELERGEGLAARIPGARLEKLEGAGHQSNVDSPDEVSRLIKNFLAEVRQGAGAASSG